MGNDNLLNDLEFEQRIGELNDRELSEFTARQVFESRKDIQSNTRRIKTLEKKSNKIIAITGSASSMIGGAIVALINHFSGKA